jgi:putative hydrolase
MIAPFEPPRQDMHVHSTFSDGRGTIEENAAAALARGLDELQCVDHVRRSTDWVPAYLAAVERIRRTTPLTLHCAVEAKLLDTTGALDLPGGMPDVDAILVADHQVPLPDGPHDPADVGVRIASGELELDEVIEAIVASTIGAVERYPGVVIAHLFSVLPKLGATEADVPPASIDRLAAATAAAGARIEISERWRCPSTETLRPFLARGVPVLLSTDSHQPAGIGRYAYVLETAAALAAVHV